MYICISKQHYNKIKDYAHIFFQMFCKPAIVTRLIFVLLIFSKKSSGIICEGLMLPGVQECPKEKESIKEATVMSTNNPPRQFVNWTETLPRHIYSKDPVTSMSLSISDNEVSVSVLIGMIEMIFCNL